MTTETDRQIAEAVLATLISDTEIGASYNDANVVDGLFAIARALHGVAAAIRSSHPFGDKNMITYTTTGRIEE